MAGRGKGRCGLKIKTEAVITFPDRADLRDRDLELKADQGRVSDEQRLRVRLASRRAGDGAHRDREPWTRPNQW